MRSPAQHPHSVLTPSATTRSCRLCGSGLTLILDFGKMPLANAFLKPENFDSEYFFNLAAGFCTQCYLFQLMEQPSPSQMFHPSYPFYTGSSARMIQHFEIFAQEMMEFLKPNSFVVELGSNDGTLLENFQREGHRCLGVDPAQNMAERTKAKGILTFSDFFSKTLAETIQKEQGFADLLIATNCLCHIPDLESVFRGMDGLLSPGGIAIFEDPYLGDVLEKTAYDQIYDEHVYLFSVTSMTEILSRYGFELFDLQPQWTHGGSMRYFVQRKGQRKISPRVHEFLQKEEQNGIKNLTTYELFRLRCEESRRQLVDCLQNFKRKSIPVVGYAATSKSTTVLNYCGIGPELIHYVCDTTPEKQGKLTPGMHIPVLPYETFQKNHPKVAVLFAWNHREEILAKENAFREAGGQWIHYIPEVRVD